MRNTRDNTPGDNHCRPLQIVHSFEGLINGVDMIEVLPWGRGGRDYLDCSNFKERVRTELEKLAARGVGGIVVNVDFACYLEDEEAWGRFITGLEIAVGLDLKIWLYDEKGHPSGYAGGLTLKDHPELEARCMMKLTIAKPQVPYAIDLPGSDAELYAVFGVDDGGERINLGGEKGSTKASIVSGSYKSLEIYFVAPRGDQGISMLPSFCCCKRYTNVLDSRAMDRFLSVTHLRYFTMIPEHLWTSIDSIFTDEMSMACWHKADENVPYCPAVPWSNEVESVFFTIAGHSIEENINSLFEGQEAEDKRIRRYYRQSITELWERSVSRMNSVCSAINIDLTGHLLGAGDIYGNAVKQGNMLRTLPLLHRPGIDMLTSDPDKLMDHVFECKLLSSAGVLGNRKSLMVEVSEWCEYWMAHPEREKTKRQKLVEECKEYWTEDRDANSIEEIRHTIAFLFLFGVRDFSFYYTWRNFTVEEYRDITDFTTSLCSHGVDSVYEPECALYYPIETMWEEYLPQQKNWNLEGLDLQSERLKQANAAMSDTCRKLFLDNIQYFMCDTSHLHKLLELKVPRILFPPVGEPESRLTEFCDANGIELVRLDRTGPGLSSTAADNSDLQAGEGVVYSRTNRFRFCLNLKREHASVACEGAPRAFFPSRGQSVEAVQAPLELNPLESVFLFSEQ